MKIAVASQNFRTVTAHAGRARRFIVYEITPGGEPQEVERLDLPKELAMHDWHGEGVHPLDAVDVVIASSMGEGFARRMANRGIAALATEKEDPLEAAQDFVTRIITAAAEAAASADDNALAVVAAGMEQGQGCSHHGAGHGEHHHQGCGHDHHGHEHGHEHAHADGHECGHGQHAGAHHHGQGHRHGHEHGHGNCCHHREEMP